MSTRVLRSFPRSRPLHTVQLRRSFITLPGTEPTTLSATRILPYNSNRLYEIIADVDSYSTFLPYCLSSKVTRWSGPDPTNKRWPSEADLKVGWGGYQESFISRLYCVPGSVVEALGGEAVTSLPQSQVAHHKDTHSARPEANDLFRSIRASWMVKPLTYKPPSGQAQTDKAEHQARQETEVHLSLDFQFSNPIYAALSQAVAPKVVGIMIDAFEVRARKLLDGPGAKVHANAATEKIEAS